VTMLSLNVYNIDHVYVTYFDYRYYRKYIQSPIMIKLVDRRMYVKCIKFMKNIPNSGLSDIFREHIIHV
jgi:hypothetical protein